MCFTAGASFTAGAVLTAAGGATLTQVRARRELMFALFPLIFAVHQINEGLLWLALTGRLPALWQNPLTLGFLLVAFGLWPVYSPLSVLLLEPRKERRRIICVFLLLGISLSLFLVGYLLTGHFGAIIVNCSIYYHTFLPYKKGLSLMYVAAVFCPYLFCSHRMVAAIGLVNILFCGLAYAYYLHAFVSVWCFFASALSVMIYLFFRRLHSVP